jgi:predicted metal-dependent HD superfamily phosphohydrolase
MKAGEVRHLMRSRWLKFLESISGSGIVVRGNPEQVLQELDRCYSEEHRHYHNWVHISACLDELEAARSLAIHPTALEMAVWFHDAVYVPLAPNNEELSARMAQSAAESMNLPSETIREVETLILATRYLTDHDTPHELCPQDSALIRDFDLSILGKTRDKFDSYEEAIGLEYSSVPDRERWQRRIHILEGFLALPKLYTVPHFQKRYEHQARQNLSRSICRLRKLLAA